MQIFGRVCYGWSVSLSEALLCCIAWINDECEKRQREGRLQQRGNKRGMDQRTKMRVADETEIFGWVPFGGQISQSEDCWCGLLVWRWTLIRGGLFKNVMIGECAANQPVIKHPSRLIQLLLRCFWGRCWSERGQGTTGRYITDVSLFYLPFFPSPSSLCPGKGLCISLVPLKVFSCLTSFSCCLDFFKASRDKLEQKTRPSK